MNILQANLLAFVILLALLLGGILAFSSVLQSTPLTAKKRWFAGWLLLFALLGFPALYDLLQTSGIPLVFALWITVVLVEVIVIALRGLLNPSRASFSTGWHNWLLLLCVSAGMLVAGYLTYVDLTATPSVCGVSSHGCVTVQSSSYARLFGFLPVGVVGLGGYLAILGVWLLEKSHSEAIKKAAPLALWGLCFFGVAFSAYLTYLEVFVIQATCNWCITSAVLMLLLLWNATPQAQAFFLENQKDEETEPAGLS